MLLCLLLETHHCHLLQQTCRIVDSSPYLKYWIKVLDNAPNLFTKITASLDKSVFNESENKKSGTAKEAAKRKADNDLVKAFPVDFVSKIKRNLQNLTEDARPL
jgi:hypothetical protein